MYKLMWPVHWHWKWLDGEGGEIYVLTVISREKNSNYWQKTNLQKTCKIAFILKKKNQSLKPSYWQQDGLQNKTVNTEQDTLFFSVFAGFSIGEVAWFGRSLVRVAAISSESAPRRLSVFRRSRGGTRHEDIRLVSLQAPPVRHLCCRKPAACPIFPSLSRRREASRGRHSRHREGWRDTKCCGWHLDKSRTSVTVAAAFCRGEKQPLILIFVAY